MAWLVPVAVLLLAVAMYTRFGVGEELRRDESIYAYAGQQLAEGVPPYVSILDPKTPLASILAGLAVAVGRVGGADDLLAIRLLFFVVSCLTVLAVHLAAAWLFRSRAAGVVAAAVFVGFEGFAIDALGGPNAKTPGILFATAATALVVRRHWFAAGMSGALALLVWQPLAIYALIAIVAAGAMSEAGERWRNVARAVAGAALPGIVTLAYFAAAGALPELVEGAFLLPVTGTERQPTALPEHLTHIVRSVVAGYGAGGATLLGAGLAALVVLGLARVRTLRSAGEPLAADPLLVGVLPPLAFIVAFSLVDFQGYPDAYPLLPPAALGVGGAAALLLAAVERRWPAPVAGVPVARIGLGLATAALLLVTWTAYSAPRREATALRRQERDVTAVEDLLLPGERLLALGDPAPLVLSGRRNPLRTIYLAAGVDRWVVETTPGGFEGWTAQIAATDPDAIVIGGWTGEYGGPMRAWLRDRYRTLRVGNLHLFVTPEVAERAGGPAAKELLRYAA